ncbi:MAG: hypothetical protein Q9170_005824 [Blastenia crenularia]
MFAVPGWSVAADKLKAQQEYKSKDSLATTNSSSPPEATEKKSKKRKRGQGQKNGIDVTTDNVADLWQKYIEEKESTPKDGANTKPEKSRKKQKRRKGKDEDLSPSVNKDIAQGAQGISEISSGKNNTKPDISQRPANNQSGLHDGKARYENRKTKAHEKTEKLKSDPPPTSHSSRPPKITKPATDPTIKPPQLPPTTNAACTIPPAPPPSSKLTPLQSAMRAKLISARFRHINQTLYTTSSTHASSLFSTNPEAFASYHAGFRAQVASWPQNPVDLFVKEIRERGAARGPKSQKQLWKEEKKKGGKKLEKKNGVGKPTVEAGTGNGLKIDPLPRSSRTNICTILDLGCGDASLHAALLPHTSSLNLSVRSYDLSQADGPNASLVTVSDIAHLPLEDNSADIAIFCLALMGTNWVDFVTEAARIVRTGGECWVGEVRSRFLGSKEFEKATSMKKAEKKSKKKGEKDDGEETGNAKIEVEEENIAGRRLKEQEMDVGPFLSVFSRRGFALKGNVDTGNKMFVRMRFVRVRDELIDGAVKQRQANPSGSLRFIDKEDATVTTPEEEAKVLKPCLYKTR